MSLVRVSGLWLQRRIAPFGMQLSVSPDTTAATSPPELQLVLDSFKSAVSLSVGAHMDRPLC